MLFALANFKNELIILSGGSMAGETFAFEIARGVWSERKLPKLNFPRHKHESCTLGNRIYVISGESMNEADKGKRFDIEFIDMSLTA